LAFLASWREQIAVLDSHWPPENLRKPRKLSKIAVQRSQKDVGAFVFYALSVVKLFFLFPFLGEPFDGAQDMLCVFARALS
jgi:hypothetical protein